MLPAWLMDLVQKPTAAQSVLVLSLAVALGLWLGQIKVRGVSLGVGGVLFSGLALGHLGLGKDHAVLDFAREFGLILFVYAIGLQVGPGFFASLRRQGLRLNLLAVAVVLGGVAVAVLGARWLGLDVPAAVGVLSGAVTNTPSLGAAQQALLDVGVPAEAIQRVGQGYALAYPFGILGIILTMLLLRFAFRVNVAREAEEFARLSQAAAAPLETRNLELTNPNLTSLSIAELLSLGGPGVVITRLFRGGEQILARPDTRLVAGDTLHAVGTREGLERLRLIAGRESGMPLPALPEHVQVRRVVVTRREFVGQHLGVVDFPSQLGVTLSRVVRAGVEFSPTRGLRLSFGDRLVLVGPEAALEAAARQVGNAVQELDRPHIIPIFVGIALGVVVGSIPVALPGMPAPVKLGLAGGPLLVALLMGRVGKVGPLLSYMPNPAKDLLREFGIVLFLACVGLKAGEGFAASLATGDGFLWMGLGVAITLLPLVLVGVAARLWLGLNYVSLCGVLAGSMTDPPALAFATQSLGSDAPSIAYATVYPLTMLLRVVSAQLVVLIWLG
jgi:putative transport protein